MAIHRPVLLDSAIDSLKIIPNGFYIDGTFGQGGHSLEILNRLDTSGHVLAVDKDPTSAFYVMQSFSTEQRFKFCYSSFAHIESLVRKHYGEQSVHGILLDLGTSATQLDTPERGFSFLKKGPLDMRMNPAQTGSAADWIAKASVDEMTKVFREYGDERWARPIAKAIYRERQLQTIETTVHLAKIIKDAHPCWPPKIHPATKIFQAIRIHINQEIKELSQCLTQSMKILAPGGRLVVITFHSLEARQVKQFMQTVIQESEPIMRWVNKGIKPSASEILHNPRARSAVLRVMEKNL